MRREIVVPQFCGNKSLLKVMLHKHGTNSFAIFSMLCWPSLSRGHFHFCGELHCYHSTNSQISLVNLPPVAGACNISVYTSDVLCRDTLNVILFVCTAVCIVSGSVLCCFILLLIIIIVLIVCITYFRPTMWSTNSGSATPGRARSNDLAGRSTALAQALAPPCLPLRITLLLR